jgi:Ca-activated chloride channel homolog
MKNNFWVSIFTLLFAFPVFAQQQQAEIIVTSTYLRKSPDFSAEKLQTLEKGEQVTIEKGREAGGWSYVSIAGRTIKGWILTRTLRLMTKDEMAATQTSDKTQNLKPPTQTQKPPLPNPPTQQTIPETVPNPTPATTPMTVETPENDNEVLKIDTEEVSLNVRVVNGNNRPVSNLNSSAFRVYEDGVLQPITAVTTTEVPLFNALVIDNSKSLRTQLSKVIEAGKIIVNTNHPQDESTVVRFVSADKIEVVQNFTSNKNLLNNALDNLFVEGGQTAIIDAVYRTAEMVEKYQNSQKKEDVKLRTLILVSDGDDRSSDYSEKQLFELLRNSYVQIYAIGFINDLSDVPDAETGISRREKARSFLTRLAEETGGRVYFPASIDLLPKIAAEISGELRTQYLISYAPTNDTRDGSFRKIKVEIANGSAPEKRTAITRTGRNAPK